MSYFALSRPKEVDARGLFDCLETSLRSIGISAPNVDEGNRLVGIDTDDASANTAAGGLKGLVEQELPWIFGMWCLAHRMELAVKGALKGTSFDDIDCITSTKSQKNAVNSMM